MTVTMGEIVPEPWTPFVRTIPNPAPGAATTDVQVPARDFWHVQAVSALLTTDATVGNRTVTLTVKDASGNIIAAVPLPGTVPASTTQRCEWLATVDTAQGANAGIAYAPLPLDRMQPGFTYEIAVGAVGAGDTLTQGVVCGIASSL